MSEEKAEYGVLTECTNAPIEALGIAFCELFKSQTTPSGVKVTKINITARSMIGPEDALDKLIKAIAFAQTQDYYPYIK